MINDIEKTAFENSKNNLKITLENILKQIRNKENLREEEINQLKCSRNLLKYYDEHSTSILFLFREEINKKTVYIYSQAYMGGNKGPIIYKPI